jgi:hypothetical protein
VPKDLPRSRTPSSTTGRSISWAAILIERHAPQPSHSLTRRSFDIDSNSGSRINRMLSCSGPSFLIWAIVFLKSMSVSLPEKWAAGADHRLPNMER